eukprot:gene35604-46175_t
MDVHGQNFVEEEELIAFYDVSRHPEVVRGRMTFQDAANELLANLKSSSLSSHDEGIVNRDQFEEYFSNVASDMKSEVDFDRMMRAAWHLEGAWEPSVIEEEQDEGVEGIGENRGQQGVFYQDERQPPPMKYRIQPPQRFNSSLPMKNSTVGRIYPRNPPEVNRRPMSASATSRSSRR